MDLYKVAFIKKDGTIRKMEYVKVSELPKDFLNERVKTNNKRNLPEHLELVWDVKEHGFRVVNHQTALEPTMKIAQNISKESL